MTDPLRKHLDTRTRVTQAQVSGHTAKLTHAQKVTPSQRKSELLRKKLSRGVKTEETPQYDCNNCPSHPCGKTMANCGEIAITMRCIKCGIKARVRCEEGKFMQDYECPVCRSRS